MFFPDFLLFGVITSKRKLFCIKRMFFLKCCIKRMFESVFCRINVPADKSKTFKQKRVDERRESEASGNTKAWNTLFMRHDTVCTCYHGFSYDGFCSLYSCITIIFLTMLRFFYLCKFTIMSTTLLINSGKWIWDFSSAGENLTCELGS